MTEEQILSKLTAMCSRSEHCTRDVMEKMRRWQVDEATSVRVLDYLKREKYVDDRRYARFFINDKVKYNRWGRRKVEQALRMKGVSVDDYADSLSELADADYEEILLPLLRSKMRSVKAASDYELKMKLVRFAMGRGFSYEQAMNSVCKVTTLT